MTFAIGYPIYNNAVNGPIGAPGIQQNGTFVVGSNIFANPANYDLYPSVGSPLINAGIYNLIRAVQYDFNGKTRSKTTPTIGAYVSDSGYFFLFQFVFQLYFVGIFNINQSWLQNH